MRGRKRLFLRLLIAAALFALCARQGSVLREVFSEETGGDVRCILDAGHGGEDGGAVSTAGTEESELNLAITLKTAQVMAFLGEDVLLMREEDISLHDPTAVTLREKKAADLKHRAAVANSFPGATLVSIHQNSYSEPQYRGAQVFYAPTEGSRTIAEGLQSALAARLQPENTRQAKPIPESVYLMQHVQNRAVLVECGFLSNPEEERLLMEDGYQKKLAVVLGCELVRAALR